MGKLKIGAKAVFLLALTGIYKLFKVLIVLAGYLLAYFGLWVPFFYAITGGALILWGDLNLEVYDENYVLFMVGLGLSVFAAVGLFVRNNIVDPISLKIKKYIDKQNAKAKPPQKSDYDADARQERRDGGYTAPHAPLSFERYGRPDYDFAPRRRPRINEERYLEYESECEPGVIVHQFEDRYELFRIGRNGALTQVGVKPRNAARGVGNDE